MRETPSSLGPLEYVFVKGTPQFFAILFFLPFRVPDEAVLRILEWHPCSLFSLLRQSWTQHKPIRGTSYN